jgi:preprotein translocase subunit SecG
MYTFITILVTIVCVLLILIVLVQNPKGGGLASNFASSNQVMGVKKTSDFLEKATWGLAIALIFFSLTLSTLINRDTNEGLGESEIQEQIDNSAAPVQSPAAVPMTAPADSSK